MLEFKPRCALSSVRRGCILQINENSHGSISVSHDPSGTGLGRESRTGAHTMTTSSGRKMVFLLDSATAAVRNGRSGPKVAIKAEPTSLRWNSRASALVPNRTGSDRCYRSVFVAPESITGFANSCLGRGAKGIAKLVNCRRMASRRLSGATRGCACHLDRQSSND
jgi:hypothetical protein